MANYVGFKAHEVGSVIPEAVVDTEYKFHNATPNNIVMYAGGTEMLKVSDDGFYVRGVKVPADDKEAEIVYNAFKQFLTWAELNRR